MKIHDNSFQTPYSVGVEDFFEVRFQLIMLWLLLIVFQDLTDPALVTSITIVLVGCYHCISLKSFLHFQPARHTGPDVMSFVWKGDKRSWLNLQNVSLKSLFSCPKIVKYLSYLLLWQKIPFFSEPKLDQIGLFCPFSIFSLNKLLINWSKNDTCTVFQWKNGLISLS